MEFEELFDDLEQKFAQQHFRLPENINLLKLQTIDKQFVDLLAPIIGVDFVAGLDPENADWLCFSTKWIASIKPEVSPDVELPLLRYQEISLTDFTKTLDRPVRVTVKYLNQSESAFNLLDADANFLIAESNQLIPTMAIYQLRMLGTN